MRNNSHTDMPRRLFSLVPRSLPWSVAGALLCLPLAGQAQTLGCLITPSKTVELGSPTVGVIEKTHVERGDAVSAKQVLVTLRSDVERAHVDLATLRASAEAELQAADRALGTAQRKLERTQSLFKQEFVSAQAVDQAEAEVQSAQARHAQANEQSRQSREELHVAKAELKTRTIRSPIDGIVVDVYRRSGERVEDKPMMKIASVNPLHAEMVLPVTMYGRLKVGDTVMVQPSLAGQAAVAGTVKLVDQVIEPASNTFRARVVLPNPDGAIPAGLRCEASLPGATAAVGTPSALPGGAMPASTVPTRAPVSARKS